MGGSRVQFAVITGPCGIKFLLWPTPLANILSICWLAGLGHGSNLQRLHRARVAVALKPSLLFVEKFHRGPLARERSRIDVLNGERNRRATSGVSQSRGYKGDNSDVDLRVDFMSRVPLPHEGGLRRRVRTPCTTHSFARRGATTSRNPRASARPQKTNCSRVGLTKISQRAREVFEKSLKRNRLKPRL